MKRMLSYYAKKRWHIVLITSLILLAITFVYLIDADYVYDRELWDQYGNVISVQKTPQHSPFGLLSSFAAILATIVPIFEFYYKMRKVSVDQFHALPIKREKIYLAKYIVCLAEILIPLTLSFIASLILIVIKENIFHLEYFIVFYLALVFVTIVLFTSISFVYTRCNTFFDGLINILAYSIILVPIVSIITMIFDIKYRFGDPSWFFLYSPITRITVILDQLFEYGYLGGNEVKVMDYISLPIFIAFGVLSFILFIKLNKEEKSENSMQISKSRFAYKLTLPAYIIPLMAMSIESSSPILMVLVVIFGYFGYVVYRRSFKLTKYDYYMLFINVVMGLILGIVLGIFV